MTLILTLLAAVSLALWLILGTRWLLGNATMTRLAHAAPPDPDPWPAVSIVVPARNEAPQVEAALRSLLELDYPALEVVAVDDRSDDATGAIFDALAADDPRLTVVHVRELPGGWLGKSHALQLGAERSNGDWLLFTDADVVFRRDALRRAVAWAETRDLDHLAALPWFVTRGPLLAGFVTAFAMLLSLVTRPWAARNPRSKASIGVGAFGLVRRDAYDAIGGHAAFAMHPHDDLELGRRLKAAGRRQEAVLAPELLAVEWYPGLGAALRGLEKNLFAGFGYRVGYLAFAVTALMLTHVGPFVWMLWPDPWVRGLGLVTVGWIVALYAANARFANTPVWLGLLHPVSLTLFCWAALVSAVKALRAGGIDWRGTRYPLDEVRRQVRRKARG